MYIFVVWLCLKSLSGSTACCKLLEHVKKRYHNFLTRFFRYENKLFNLLFCRCSFSVCLSNLWKKLCTILVSLTVIKKRFHCKQFEVLNFFLTLNDWRETDNPSLPWSIYVKQDPVVNSLVGWIDSESNILILLACCLSSSSYFYRN